MSPSLLMLALLAPAQAQEGGEGFDLQLVLSVTDQRPDSDQGELKAIVLSDGQPHGVALADDGEPPDRQADDGVHSGHLQEAVGTQLEVTILDADDQPLWSGEVAREVGDAVPRLDVVLDGGAGQVTIGRVKPAPTTAAASGSPQTAATTGAVPPAAMPAPTPAPARPWLALIGTGLAGLLVGAGLGWSFSRPRRLLRRLRWTGDQGTPSTPTGWPAVHGRHQAWSVPADSDLDDALLTVARALTPVAAVLVLPRPDSRDALATRLAGVAGLSWSNRDQPRASVIWQLAALLRHTGPVVVLVQGADALEAPLKEESPDAVVAEVLDKAPDWVSVVALVVHSASPTMPIAASLERDGDQLRPAAAG